MNAYVRPGSLDDALARLSERPHRVLAGGTDVFPADATAVGWGKPGIGHPDSAPILDIGGLDALGGIRRLPDRTEIGALVTWTEAIDSDLPAWFDGVRMAAREVGGRQIQNRGTLAGNLCNASPAADGVPPLLVLNARVRLRHRGGARELPLRDFITGNRRTCLRAGELMTAIVIPSPGPGTRSTFLKLGARRYLVISIAMTAACLELQGRAHPRCAPCGRGVLRDCAAPAPPGSTPGERTRGRSAGHGARGGLCGTLSTRRRARIRVVPPARRAHTGATGARRAAPNRRDD